MEAVRGILNTLSGKKTYLALFAEAVYRFGVNKGFWSADPNIELAILTFLGIALRSALAKLGKP